VETATHETTRQQRRGVLVQNGVLAAPKRPFHLPALAQAGSPCWLTISHYPSEEYKNLNAAGIQQASIDSLVDALAQKKQGHLALTGGSMVRKIDHCFDGSPYESANTTTAMRIIERL